MTLPPSHELPSQSLKGVLDNLGGVGSLQREAQRMAEALTPAIDSLKLSLGSLPPNSAIAQIRGSIDNIDRLREIRDATSAASDRWAQLSRSLESIDTRPIEHIPMPRVTPLSEHLDKALINQEKRQSIHLRQQSELLSEIAAAGREQNQTMISMAKLQETLVNESIENSRVQRVVLIFSAASVLFSLLALIVAK